MELASLLRLRPFAYHLTARSNLSRILSTGRLDSASTLYRKANCDERIGIHRPSHDHVVIDGERVHVRDQSPLHSANVDLSEQTFSDVVSMLNQYVYFWPGDQHRPIPSGRNHFSRYAAEDCVVMVLPTDRLFAANESSLRFSRCNSGAPRQQGGRKQPRGAQTFRRAEQFEDTPGRVVEIVVEGSAVLPPKCVDVRSLRDIDLHRE
jgi:hypothetical protein